MFFLPSDKGRYNVFLPCRHIRGFIYFVRIYVSKAERNWLNFEVVGGIKTPKKCLIANVVFVFSLQTREKAERKWLNL